MIRTAVASAAAFAVLVGGAGAAAADSGNHGAIWKAGQHGVSSGTEWGSTIGDLASGGGLKPYGVSEGVHMAKGNGPK